MVQDDATTTSNWEPALACCPCLGVLLRTTLGSSKRFDRLLMDTVHNEEERVYHGDICVYCGHMVARPGPRVIRESCPMPDGTMRNWLAKNYRCCSGFGSRSGAKTALLIVCSKITTTSAATAPTINRPRSRRVGRAPVRRNQNTATVAKRLTKSQSTTWPE